MGETYTDGVTTDSYINKIQHATESGHAFSHTEADGKGLAIISLHYILATLGIF